MVKKLAQTCLLVRPSSLSHVLVLLRQHVQDLLDRRNFLLPRLVCQTRAAQVSAQLLQSVQLLLHPLNVLQPELRRDDLHVSQRVDIPLDVDDLGVVERSNTLEDTVDSSNVRQESVSETGTGRGSGGQTGNVDTSQEGGHLGFGLVQVAQPQESLVRDRDSSLLRVAGDEPASGARWLEAYMVAYGKLADLPRSVLERVLKKDDLPTLGRPTIPICDVSFCW